MCYQNRTTSKATDTPVDYPFEKSPIVLYGEMIDGDLRPAPKWRPGFCLPTEATRWLQDARREVSRRSRAESRLLYSTCISVDITTETTRAILDRIPPVTHADTARPTAALDLRLI